MSYSGWFSSKLTSLSKSVLALSIVGLSFTCFGKAVLDTTAIPAIATAADSNLPRIAPSFPKNDRFVLSDINDLRLSYVQSGWMPLEAKEPGFSEVAIIQADGQFITSANIKSDWFPPYVSKEFDPRLSGAPKAITTTLQPHDQITAGSWRTQIASYPLYPYRTYCWILCFRLDDSWDLNTEGQAGLLWQLKGQPKPSQYGNPVIAFNLDQERLYCEVLYPSAALRQPLGSPVQWGRNEYEKVALPSRRVEKGRYYLLEIEFFADDRPPSTGGRGYLKAKLDGLPWIDYVGPTLHPDQIGLHQPIWGWYQWGGKLNSTRIVWWIISEGYFKS